MASQDYIRNAWQRTPDLRRSLRCEDWSTPTSNLLDHALEKRDYRTVQVLIDSCPIFWAGVRYQQVVFRDKGLAEEETYDKKFVVVLKKSKPISGTQRFTIQPHVQELVHRTFFDFAIRKNEKILVQMLLDGVVQVPQRLSAYLLRGYFT